VQQEINNFFFLQGIIIEIIIYLLIYKILLHYYITTGIILS